MTTWLNKGALWYLPILITHNQNKPEKVSIVWDAAAKSQEKSLNDFMFTGPDLLKPLTDVLEAHRVGNVDVCGDIADMFQQIYGTGSLETQSPQICTNEKNLLSEEAHPTKLDVLQILMSIFDTLGFLSCFIIVLKIILKSGVQK